MAQDVVERLRRAGSVERGWLGVTVQPFDRKFARYYGDSTLTGVLVGDVEAGSPAEAIGLLQGDVILTFGDEDLDAENNDDLNSFILLVSSYDVDDRHS